MSTVPPNDEKREVKRPDPFVIFAVSFSVVVGGGLIMIFLTTYFVNRFTDSTAGDSGMVDSLPQLAGMGLLFGGVMALISLFWDENKLSRRERKKLEKAAKEAELPKQPWEKEGFDAKAAEEKALKAKQEAEPKAEK
jgi:hypothetical protein